MGNILVKLTITNPEWPIIRQTPGSNGLWDECQFLLEPDIRECNYWIVYDDLRQPETTTCPPQNTILVTAEPPEIKRYPRRFTRQFGTVVTCQRNIQHPHIIYSQQALPWHVGRRQLNHKNLSFSKDYDELSAMHSFNKSRLISAIASNKVRSEGHRKRVEFVRNLSILMGRQLDVFGRGIQEIEDKWDAIAPYRYHIALENSAVPDYWTEKLSDAFLAGAFPFYYGCPNIGDYFPNGSLIPIPLDAEVAYQIIRDAIEDGVYEKRQAELAEARDLVLNKYNLFPMICNLVNSMQGSGRARPVTIYPISHFPPSAFEVMLTKLCGLTARWKGIIH